MGTIRYNVIIQNVPDICRFGFDTVFINVCDYDDTPKGKNRLFSFLQRHQAFKWAVCGLSLFCPNGEEPLRYSFCMGAPTLSRKEVSFHWNGTLLRQLWLSGVPCLIGAGKQERPEGRITENQPKKENRSSLHCLSTQTQCSLRMEIPGKPHVWKKTHLINLCQHKIIWVQQK